MADIKLFDVEELKEQAESKRKENDKFDEYENPNPYTKANMEELLTGEPSKGVAAADFVMDMIPSAIMLFAGKAAKKTPSYKRAKLRETANMTDYSMTGPGVLTRVEGSADAPHGQLSRVVKHYYGKDDTRRVFKELENELWKQAKILKKKYPKLTDQEIVDIYEAIRTGKEVSKIGSEDVNAIKNAIKEINFTPAQTIVDKNIKTSTTPSGKVKIEVNAMDKAASNAPSVLKSTSALLGAGNVADKAWKLRSDDGKEEFDRLKKGEKGLQPSSPFFTVTELLDNIADGSWRYNKKEATKEANKIFDYIQENGTEEQLRKAYEIYANADFNKRKEAANALKDLLKLVNN